MNNVPHLPKEKKLYEKNRVDRAIDEFASLEKPTISDLNKVGVSEQVQLGIEQYRARGREMLPEDLEAETHNSTLLGQFMELEGDPRPHQLCDAHAIVSGGHTLAARTRAVLAWFQRRIDDPVNGCWLPRNTAAKSQMPKGLKNAVPHSRIHRKKYYRWLNRVLSLTVIKNDAMLVQTLKMIETKLQHGSFPPEIMEP